MTDIRKGKGDEASFDAEYDFSSMKWGDEADQPNAKSAEADPFGEDDGFSPFGNGGSDSAFGQDGAEDFTFESMPEPGASGVPGIGNADDEFADIPHEGVTTGGDAFDEGDAFEAEPLPLRGGSRSRDAFDDEDAGEDRRDVFEDPDQAEDHSYEADGNEEEEIAEAAPAPARTLLSKLIVPAVLAVVGVAGYVGYGTLFTSAPEAPPKVASNEAPLAGPVEFPRSLPGAAKPAAGPVPVELGKPGPQPQPVTPGLSIPEMPRSTLHPPAATPTPIQIADDDLVGGKRDGIPSTTSQLPVAQAPSAPASNGEAELARQIETLRREFVGMQRDLADLKGRLAGAPSAILPVAPITSTPVRAAALPADVVPPLKPAIVEGVSLKGVSVKPGARDVAWVSTKSGVVEVSEGDDVPEAGQVIKLRPYNGDWILVTSKGIVTR